MNIRLDDSVLDETAYSPVCSYCARLLDIVARRCEAFERIPDEIWEGQHSHRTPYPGDGGKLFVHWKEKTPA